MRVVSGLADLDFHVGRIARDGSHLIVTSRNDAGIPTTVYVDRDDLVQGLMALLRSPRALLFLLSAPLRRPRRAASGARQTLRGGDSDVNNPWR